MHSCTMGFKTRSDLVNNRSVWWGVLLETWAILRTGGINSGQTDLSHFGRTSNKIDGAVALQRSSSVRSEAVLL